MRLTENCLDKIKDNTQLACVFLVVYGEIFQVYLAVYRVVERLKLPKARSLRMAPQRNERCLEIKL